MSSRSVSTRTESRMVNGVMETVTVTEETITHPDGRVEKKTTTNTSQGGGGGGGGGGFGGGLFGGDNWGQMKLDMSSGGGFGLGGYGDVNNKFKAAEAAKPLEPGEFQQKALAKHNEYRAKHGAPPLNLCPKLCGFAQEWADQMSASGNFSHRPKSQSSYGENIFYGMNSRGVNPLDAVDKWYSENGNYNFSRPGFSSNTGHFTQVVWEGSKTLGIAFAQPNPSTVYVVANYDPAGNVQGHYEANVHPSK